MVEVGIIGACYGLGGRSVETSRAPQFFRDKGLLERLQTLGVKYHDYGDLFPVAPSTSGQSESPRNLSAFLAYGPQLYDRTLTCLRAGHFPLILGGDHSISVASIAAAASHCKQTNGPTAQLGVLWVDAHADINTPQTSPSQALHGMSIAMLLGKGPPDLCNMGAPGPHINPNYLSYIGLRDLDPPEKKIIRELGIQAFTMQDIDRYGIGQVIERALATVSTGTQGYVLSFDLDVCDPNLAPGVTTPVRGGITFRESHLIMELAAETPGLQLVEVVEYNPSLDRDGITCDVALSLIESVLGKRIL